MLLNLLKYYIINYLNNQLLCKSLTLIPKSIYPKYNHYTGNTHCKIECLALHSKPKNHKNQKEVKKNMSKQKTKPKVGGIMGGYANLLSA